VISISTILYIIFVLLITLALCLSNFVYILPGMETDMPTTIP